MELDDLSPDQQRQIEADHADFDRQLLRTGVDLRAASPQLHEVEEPRYGDVVTDDADDVESYTVSYRVDFSGILEILRLLPDGAGTSAFVAAYNAAHRDWRDRPSNER